MQMQLTPVQQQAQLIAAKERERADNSRFASNLVYSRSADPPQQQQQGQTMPAQYGPAERQTNSSLVSPPAEGKQEDTPGGYKRPLEANIDSAVGQPYLVYEGSASCRTNCRCARPFPSLNGWMRFMRTSRAATLRANSLRCSPAK